MRAVLVVNPHATSTTGRRRDLLAHALASELRLAVEQTNGRGHASELAARATEAGADLVVVHGGDGTVNEVVNGIMKAGTGTRPMIAVVPGGSTNVFARALGVDPDPTGATEQILEALAERRLPRRISLGLADDRYFTFNAGLGLDAEVVHAVEEVRGSGRAISNSLHVRKTLRHYLTGHGRTARLTLELPGREPIPGVHLAFVSNVDPWTYWEKRAIRTNPGTTADGGLGVFALTSMKVPTVARVVGQLLRSGEAPPRAGALIREDDVPSAHVRCSEPVGLQVDGDYLGTRSEVRFRSVPGALGLFGPPAETDTPAAGD
ncbi:diacylglycerol kinase family lipid kinase [Nakamurella sp. YIM 132087]|uniref:Diacylglycerol kinase family lipid kinase n=1 Tax=Nakamurella alba TaxID=2665158 RepID=A0A7K1FFZ9_9ACTN|nr:diacylglycerol kinase family lipid kinase [Nakamurella alba]